ncbi:class I SAM-dependent methyltransferase [Polaromonas sp.]|uniref:class I SAM-dependent methyltransferase n=1 Tax=Polaromonas sp. TaxID=1869339 RepID=UPI00248A4335|nr:class I SAM-dependent methyltransferase [Polaromonas sp.]MDI1338900.1 class I SAM-dependent methyltransferase [Polaromonas sp.]
MKAGENSHVQRAPALPQSLAGLQTDVERYYTQKVRTHGATALGVDWTCQPTQELRFVQLLKVCDFAHPFSLNDVGCGYGALLAFLARRHSGAQVDYLGTELSQAMVDHARPSRHPSIRSQFLVTGDIPRIADYSVASGIFNVKLKQPAALWTLFVQQMLAAMHEASRVGFAVNFLAPLKQGMQDIPELYRPSPEVWVRYCTHQFNAKVELACNYGMCEFTLIVRR